MGSSTTGVSYDTLKQSVASTKNWKDGANKLQQDAKDGRIPSHYEQVGDNIKRQYDNLDAPTQQALDNMPPDAKTSFFHLIGSLNEMGQTNRTQWQHVSQFITQCVQQNPTPSR